MSYDRNDFTLNRLHPSGIVGGSAGATHVVRFPFPVILRRAHVVTQVQGTGGDAYAITHGATVLATLTPGADAAGVVRSTAMLNRSIPAGELLVATYSGGANQRSIVTYEYEVDPSANM